METDTHQKPLRVWEPGYVPEDYTNKKLVAHFRYSAQAGPDSWSEFSDYKEVSGTTTLKEVWDWKRDCKAACPISLTISELA